MKITGKYTDCDIFAKTLEDGIYSQIYDIINSKAFKDKKVCVMPTLEQTAFSILFYNLELLKFAVYFLNINFMFVL